MDEQKPAEASASTVPNPGGVQDSTVPTIPTPAQGQTLTPEQQKQMLQLNVASDAKVKVRIIRPAPAEGAPQPVDEFDCSRNATLLKQELEKHLGPPSDALKTITIEISIKGTLPDGKDVQVVMFGGPAIDVMAALTHRSVTPQEAVIALRRFMSEMAELADMKACIMTALFEGEGVGGFSIINQTVDVGPQHLVMLALAAKGHAEKFGDDLKKQGIKMPDTDANRIITPGSAKFGLPNLRVLKGKD